MKRTLKILQPCSFYSDNEEYLLMNKDIKLCKFSIELFKEVPTGVFNKGNVINIEYIREIDFELVDFINNRQPPKHRQHIDKLLKLCDIYDIISLIEYTHLTSLNDTFWVKSVNSHLTWSNVSLYTNPLMK